MKGASSSKDESVWRKQIKEKSNIAISVDCVIFGYDEMDLKVMLIKSDMPDYRDHLSLPGDLVDVDENLNSAANRVLTQRTGLTDVFMEQVEAFSEVKRHPYGRVITVAYYSLVEISAYQPIEAGAMKPQWFSVKDIDFLAFDHLEILNNCLSRLRLRLQEQPVGFKLLPEKFTLKQLQNLYEMVLNLKLDKRNFRRKLKSLDILIDLEERQIKVTHRPAKLYSFDMEKYLSQKKKGMFINF